jgi:DNA modification methylase
MKKKKHLNIKSTDDLNPAEYNPRTITVDAITGLRNSIGTTGDLSGIVVNVRTGNLVSGHQRLKAIPKGCQITKKKAPDKTGTVAVGVIKLPNGSTLSYREVDWAINKEKAANITANNPNIQGNWDLLKLEPLLKELEGFSGFDLLRLNTLADELSFDLLEEQPEEDFNPQAPKNSSIKKGDIIEMGNHKLMCGDSTDQKQVSILLKGKKADMSFLDPPYLMNFVGSVHADGSKSQNAKYGKILNDKMTKPQSIEFLSKLVAVAKANTKGAFYICFYRLGLQYLFNALEEHNLKYRGLIIWNKMNHTLSNSDYMSRYEPIVYGWIKDHKFYGQPSFDIWDIPRTKVNDLHPTMKPLELVETAIKNSSKKGDSVLDLFGGSGSTLIGCERVKRCAFLMELDERYCHVIVQRWCDYTGKDKIVINGKKVLWSKYVPNQK